MYNNIAVKLKLIAKLIFFVGAAFSLICGIILIAIGGSVNARSYSADPLATGLIWYGIATIIFGSAAAFAVSFIVYGYVEKLQMTMDMQRRLANIEASFYRGGMYGGNNYNSNNHNGNNYNGNNYNGNNYNANNYGGNNYNGNNYNNYN